MQLKIAAKTEGRVFGLANNGAQMRSDLHCLGNVGQIISHEVRRAESFV